MYEYTYNHISEVKQWRNLSACATARHDDFRDRILDLIENTISGVDILKTLCEFGSIKWLQFIHGRGGYEWLSVG